MKILVADDDLTSRLLLHQMLSLYGECYLAACGQEAWALVQTAIDKKSPFTLICLDITMPPGENGLELAGKIRKYEHGHGIFTQQRSKILMISAEEDRKVVLKSFSESECDGYLVKPVFPEKINEELRKLRITGDNCS